ncbi:hypothetical protein [Streptomyces sp. DSM 40484]|uniref:hypothetical protein n=1 Tax=Streptomyces kroppenstedtii TaxID=3051181 RepID=UPI0028D7F496|nr:hypothetical protein [Streptomyces sp. DSM 40484]
MSNDPPTADAKPQASTDEGSGERSLPAIDWAALRRRNDRRRARRRQVGGAVGAALLAAVFLGAWIATRGEEQPPVRYTAELPTVFDDYRLAGPGESLWDKTGIGENLDPTTETAHATYVRSDGKKSFIITVDLDPVADVSDPGEGDDIVSMILGTSVDSAEAKSYDPGSIAGKLL